MFLLQIFRLLLLHYLEINLLLFYLVHQLSSKTSSIQCENVILLDLLFIQDVDIFYLVDKVNIGLLHLVPGQTKLQVLPLQDLLFIQIRLLLHLPLSLFDLPITLQTLYLFSQSLPFDLSVLTFLFPLGLQLFLHIANLFLEVCQVVVQVLDFDVLELHTFG